MAEKRYGNQKPRIDIYKNGDIWLADKTIQLMEHYGYKLLPWQKSILYRWMAVEETSPGSGVWKWVNTDCGLLVPRQNGKSELIIVRIIGGMVFLGEALIYTAQSDFTVAEIKRRVQRFFYDAEAELRNLLTAEFDKEPKSLDYVELRNRGRCVFRTRTRTNGLGSTNDVLILDEDQEETDAQQEALLPTISSGKNQNHQTIRAGTPPSGGGSGTVFMRMRKNVLDGKAPDICWQEWSVESIADPHDEEAWYATNPSLNYFLMRSAVKSESQKMAIDSFNKMRLGWVAGVENMRAISDDLWTPLAVEQVELPEHPNMVYAVKFAPDGSAVSLAVGVVMPDGRIHVELVERKPMSAGTAWLAAWLLERWRRANKIIIDGAAGTQLLVEELVRSQPKLKKRILTPNAREAGAAYADFYTGLENKLVTHFDQPALNVSIRTVKKRGIGKDGMFGYASMNPDIQSDPTEAVAFAYYGARRFKKDTASGSSSQSVMV
jgi:hypothetical protein